MNSVHCKVAIIGAGPSGLSAAIELRKCGVDSVVVIEREAEAGGIPRHCGHSPYGMREFHRIMSGPSYAARLLREATELGVQVKLQTSVITLEPGELTISNTDGVKKLTYDRAIICTGNREMPRSSRLVSGTRPAGVLNTGALQSMVYLKNRIPFRNPVIVGSELVAFSAILTCRHAGIKPVAMIEPNERITAWKFAALLPPIFGCQLLRNHTLEKINGRDRVESVVVSSNEKSYRQIDCDGVVFCGNFVAESTLIRSSHLDLDPRGAGPVVDQFGRCSDPNVFACGNLTHPVDTAGWCWAEGQRIAQGVADSLSGKLLPPEFRVEIECKDPAIKYFTPQRLSGPAIAGQSDSIRLQCRIKYESKGELKLQSEHRVLQKRRLHAKPERRILLLVPRSGELTAENKLSIQFST